MKLTAALLTIFSLYAGARGYTQTVTLSAKGAPLEKIFIEIQKQTGYGFVYRWELLQDSKTVDINVDHAALKTALDICFKDQPLSYRIVDNTIIINKKESGVPVTEITPVIDIKGKVINEKGEPVAGASVSVKGGKKLTTTNDDGEFFLTGVNENDVLLISHISYETQEIKLNGKNEIMVKLQLNVSELSVYSVNTGYQVLKPNEVTGSIATVSQEQLDRRISTDIISKLEGITSGLVFNRFGSGNISNLSIRGRSTIFANVSPLIIVDNFPYDGDINNINPNDVESVTILKDAASASIWGVRAGNGVIVITTKKGKSNQPLRIEFNTNVTVGEKPDLFYNKQFLNSSDFIDVEIFLFNKGFYNSDLTSSSKTPISPVVEILNKRRLGQISSSDSVSQIDALRNLDIRNQLLNFLYQKTIKQQYSVNLRGGAEKSSYYLSAGADKNLSSLVGNETKRITLSSAISLTPFKNFEISTAINYIQTENEVNNIESSIVTGGSKYGSSIYPYAQLADANGQHLPIVKDYREIYADTMGSGKFLNWRFYPLDELEFKNSTSGISDIRINPSIKYTLFKGLSAEIKYQYQKTFSKNEELQPIESYFTRNLINRYSTILPNGTIRNNIPLGGILSISNNAIISNNVRGQINFAHRWFNNSLVSVIGIEAREVQTEYSANRTYGYDPLTGTYLPVNFDSTYTLYPSGSGKIPDGTGFGQTLNRFRSFFTNTAYTFNNCYTLSLSGRIDQSNLFGVKTNQKSVPLWSVGAKWNLNKEKFYNAKWLPFLNLRVTYGYNGNLDNTLSAYLIANYVSGGTSTAPYNFADIITPGNPELRWEKSGMFNVGVDFEVVEKIFFGSIDFFTRKGVDLIGETPFYSSSGVTSTKINYANMKGNGIDLVLSSNILNRALKWQVRFLFSWATDKITKYDIPPTTSGKIVGRPVQLITSLPWAGLDPQTGDPRGYLADTISKNYGALNALTVDKRVYNGPANPIISGGFQNIFSWKNLSLSFNISFKGGYYFQRNSISYSSLFNNWRGHQDFTLRWEHPGDEKSTNIPSMIYPTVSARETFYANSEALVEKGDHIRFQDINLDYTIDKKQWRKTPFESLTVYVYINNLGILWKANNKGIDPDYQTGYPAVKTISFGLRTAL